tara:strand:+ start:2596 stop:3243 length:648 start_codon:yes stop_codon:yes gene_type:complete
LTTAPLSLHHIIKPSSLTKKAPVIFMFHGYGSDENDLFSFATELDDKYMIISVRAPQPMQPYGNAWYTINFDAAGGKFSNEEEAIESRDKISNFIDEALKAYPIDEDNVTLLGFSQGTILSYAVALSYPEKIKRVVALSGYVNEDILVEGYQDNDFSNLSFYCSHGSVDQVIPIDWARKAKPFLDQLNIKYKYSEFPVGHGVAPQNFYEFKTWLD